MTVDDPDVHVSTRRRLLASLLDAVHDERSCVELLGADLDAARVDELLTPVAQIGSVQPGYVIWRDRAPSLHRGYLAAIAALARAGNHVAVPAAAHGQAEFADALGDIPTITVGLRCDPLVLVERERRSGRWGGIAADSLAAHDGWRYDIEFDTTDGPDPVEMARHVLEFLDVLSAR